MAQVQNKPNMVQSIAERIEQKRDLFIGVSEQIWGFAEARYEESQSAELVSEVL